MKRLFLTLALMPAAIFGAEPVRPPITAVSHIALYSADPVAAERFYAHDLGARKGEDPENPKGVRYYVSPSQFVEILPAPDVAAANRLDHVAFVTPDAKAMLAYLAARRWKVPAKLSEGKDGSVCFMVDDPEGRRVEFLQQPKSLPDMPADPLSAHIIHVGYIIRDRAAEDRFFRDVLGFRPYWFGGMRDDQASWISQQVPDGSDWLEYMVVGPGEKADRRLAGILDHFALGVGNAEAAYYGPVTG